MEYTKTQFYNNLLFAIRQQGVVEFLLWPDAIDSALETAVEKAGELGIGLEKKFVHEAEFTSTVWRYDLAYPVSPEFTRIHIQVSKEFCKERLARTGDDAEKFQELARVFLAKHKESVDRQQAYHI